jgi:hypothetical protein
MNLIPDWKRVLRKAWSLRLMLLAAVLSGVEVVLPFFTAAVPPGVFAAVSFVVVAAAFMARLTVQKSMEQRRGDDRRAKPRAYPDAERSDYD